MFAADQLYTIANTECNLYHNYYWKLFIDSVSQFSLNSTTKCRSSAAVALRRSRYAGRDNQVKIVWKVTRVQVNQQTLVLVWRAQIY